MSQRSSTPPPKHQPTADDDYAAASRSTAEYLNHLELPALRRRRKNLRIVGGLLGAIMLLVALAAGYWYGLRPRLHASKASQATTAHTKPPTAQPTGSSVLSKHYTSETFGLSLAYPEDWSVNEPAATGQLTATSPVVSLTAANGQTIKARAVLTISQKGQHLEALDGTAATAVLTSLKVNYTQPTQDQRAATYLTYAQYAATTTSGALDALYVTGDYGYQKGQDIPKSDLSGIDPLIAVNFLRCTDTGCTKTSLASLQAAAWSSSATNQTLTKMIQSLAIN